MGRNTSALQMTEKHIFTSDQKLKWWGYGQWVEEPDCVTFESGGYECIIRRVSMEDGMPEDRYVFGGHLCGYLKLPIDHPWAKTSMMELHSGVHGGITFSDGNDEEWLIGFDCGHSTDIVPSNQFIGSRGKFHELKKMFEEKYGKLPCPFEPVYRDVAFCIKELELLASEAKLIKAGKKLFVDASI